MQGFTLLEALVVIGILALLAGILFPSLAHARRCAHDARCLSNLRELGIAAQMYWDDHEGETFRYRRDRLRDGVVYWFGWLQDGEEGHRRFDPAAGALWPYLQTRGVEVCPSLVAGGPHFKLKASGLAHGYGYNLSLSPPANSPPTRPQTTVNPSGLAVLADAAQINDFQPPASPESPRLEEFYYLSHQEPTTHFRHNSKSQVLFADLHAAGHAPAAGSLDPRLPGTRVGRLPASLLVIP